MRTFEKIYKDSQPLVIYHSPCLDGFTAAWACWTKHPDWEYFPANHGDAAPQVAGRDVYLLDFSYNMETMRSFIYYARSVTVLDHHLSARETIETLLAEEKIQGKFDMEHSGAHLAWEFFHPEAPEPSPHFIRLVEDYDLWKFEVRKSKEANAYFFAEEYSFRRWSKLSFACELPVAWEILWKKGNAILRKHVKDVKELCNLTKHSLRIGDVNVWAVNLPYTMANDAGHILCDKNQKTFAAVYFRVKDRWKFSLRSEDDGMDVSEVAKLYGGGGHKHSASFTIKDFDELHIPTVSKDPGERNGTALEDE